MQDLTETIVAVEVTVNSAVDVTVSREFTLRLSKLERRWAIPKNLACDFSLLFPPPGTRPSVSDHPDSDFKLFKSA